MTNTSNTKICHVVEKTGNILTPEGVLFYAKYVLEAHPNKQGRLTHNLELCFPPDADLKALKNAMGKVALENCDGDAARAKKMVEKRFLDPNDKPQGGKPAGEEYEGWTLVRASTPTAPDFVWPNGQKMSADEAKKSINSGDFVRVTLNPYWSNNAENKGVFLGLQNMQLVRKGKAIGYVKPAGESEFGAIDGAEGVQSSSESSDSSEARGGDQVDALFG